VTRRKSIARNSFWFGLESVIDSASALIVSVVVARVIGPQRLGYYIYMMFLVNLAGRLGGCGPGAAARKYLSEAIGRGEPSLTRHVFFTMLKWHSVLGLALTVIGWVMVLFWGDAQQKLVASLLVASVFATIVNAVPSQANMAAEDFARNVPATLLSLAAYLTLVGLSLSLGWGLVGLAVAVLVRRTLEMLIRLIPAIGWARQLPKQLISSHVALKMMSFSGKSLAVTLLLMIVWDRSELVLLKHFSAIQELTFYSVAFSVTEALLLLPNVIGAAVSARLMVEYGRPRNSLQSISESSLRFLALLIFPMFVGLAALSAPVTRLFYGSAYLPAIPVLAIALLLAVPKAFYWFPSAMLQAFDRQGTMFRCLLVAAMVNIGLDLSLIPHYGAVGAAVGNGVSQAAAVMVLLFAAGRDCRIRLPWAAFAKNLIVVSVMGGVVFFVVKPLPPLAAVAAGPPLGAVLYLLLVRASGLVSSEDATAVAALGGKLPHLLHRPFLTLLGWLANPEGDTAQEIAFASRTGSAGS
jgi:O-antigen/teichoic acid export membrane protein